MISSIENFARDPRDAPTAKVALTVLMRMINVWCGPDKVGPGANQTPTSPTITQTPLPGFENYVLERFSPLAWSIPAAPGFNSKDAQAKQVLFEVANLQVEIVKKVGEPYVERLKSDLGGNGVDRDGVDLYLQSLAGALENSKKEKEWRNFFAQFIDRMLASRG
jgi:exportin-T